MFARHGWFSSTILYFALLLFPFLLYVFLYQGSRIDEATTRNFRSLDAAADRIGETLQTLHKTSKNFSLGLDSTLLDKIHKRCGPTDQKIESLAENLLEVVRDVRGQSTLKSRLRTKPLRRQPFPTAGECARKLEVNTMRMCGQGVRIEQDRLFSDDCRELRERDRRVYDALNGPDGKEGGAELIAILDLFGIEVSMGTAEAFDESTRHLSMFFDNYFIADENGDVIFAGKLSPLSHDAHRRHREGASFASLASVRDILAETPHTSLGVFGSTRDANSKAEPIPTGHSTVRHVQIDNVDLSVFIHPFIADSLKLYIIGVIPRSALTSEAIRLRLGPAVDATLAIAVLLSLLPILRFWIGGDRSIMRRFTLYSIAASAVVATALCTALLLGVISKSADSGALDYRLRSISSAVTRAFSADLDRVTARLREDATWMDNALNKKIRQNSIEGEVFCSTIPPVSLPIASPGWRPATHPYRFISTLHHKSPWSNGERWWPTSSYLLDGKGKRAMCIKYRNDRPLGLDLSFRDYFTNAKENESGFYRIDSVVRGLKQTVASLAYVSDGKRRVAVAIPKLLSVDNVILPPPFQYAVIDKDGNTIFHSDQDRISVSNFIDDSGNDAAVHAALTYKDGIEVDVNYDGVPIRAYFKRLKNVDWTLIIFRNHSVVDRVSSLAISLSIVFWILTVGILFLFLTPSIAVPRPSGERFLPAVILSTTSSRLGAIGILWALFGLTTLYVFKGFEWLVGMIWPTVAGVAIWCSAWRQRQCTEPSPPDNTHPTPASHMSPKVFALASVILSFSIIPILSWHAYFRAELSEGLAEHLTVETARRIVDDKGKDFETHMEHLAGVNEGDERLRRFFFEDSVVGFAKGRIDALIARPKGRDDAPRSLWFGAWPLFAYSPVTQQAIWYRSGDGGQIRSVSDAVGFVVNGFSDTSTPTGAKYWVGVGLALIFGTVFTLIVCYSVVRTKFGYARRIAHLPYFVSTSDVTQGTTPMRLLLVRRSECDVCRMLRDLRSSYVVKVLRWDHTSVFWTDFPTGSGDVTTSTQAETVFVVEDLRDATAGSRGGRLMEELVRKLNRNSKVILCCDVVPLYHLDPGTLDQRDSTQPMWGTEWRELLSRFQVRVLSYPGVAERERTCLSTPEQWFAHESEANVDIKVPKLQVSETRADCSCERKPWRFVCRLKRNWRLLQDRERILREFQAAAQSRFKTLWAVSSFDERAQLYAIAHGGSPNMRRPAAISSLVSRGLITDKDPIRLCSEAFGRFVVEDLDDSLDGWRRKGHRDWWRVTWLPLVLFSVLGLLFFINSNPEAVGGIAAIFAVFVGLVPIVTSLFRMGQFGQSAASSSDE